MRTAEGDVPAERVPGDGDPVEVKGVEEREQVALVVHVAVRVAVLAQAVTAKVERDYAYAVQQRDDAAPVTEVACQPVQEDDGWALPRVCVGKAFRGSSVVRTVLEPGVRQFITALHPAATPRTQRLVCSGLDGVRQE